MSFKKIFFLPLIILMTFHSYASYLVVDATINKVGSTNWNERVFYVVLSGGKGPCAGKAVNFPEDYSQSTAAYALSHSMAMTAFLHNKKVRIYNYGNKKFKNDSICTGASFIEIYN